MRLPIGKRMDLLFRPFPASPAEILANHWPTFSALSDIPDPALRGHQRGASFAGSVAIEGPAAGSGGLDRAEPRTAAPASSPRPSHGMPRRRGGQVHRFHGRRSESNLLQGGHDRVRVLRFRKEVDGRRFRAAPCFHGLLRRNVGARTTIILRVGRNDGREGEVHPLHGRHTRRRKSPLWRA